MFLNSHVIFHLNLTALSVKLNTGIFCIYAKLQKKKPSHNPNPYLLSSIYKEQQAFLLEKGGKTPVR